MWTPVVLWEFRRHISLTCRVSAWWIVWMLSSTEELRLADIFLQPIFSPTFRTLPQIPTALAPDWPLDLSDGQWLEESDFFQHKVPWSECSVSNNSTKMTKSLGFLKLYQSQWGWKSVFLSWHLLFPVLTFSKCFLCVLNQGSWGRAFFLISSLPFITCCLVNCTLSLSHCGCLTRIKNPSKSY